MPGFAEPQQWDAPGKLLRGSMAPEAVPSLSQPQARRGNYLLAFNLCSSVLSCLQTQAVLPRRLLAVWADPPWGGGRLGAQAEGREVLGTQEPLSQHRWGAGDMGPPSLCRAVTSPLLSRPAIASLSPPFCNTIFFWQKLLSSCRNTRAALLGGRRRRAFLGETGHTSRSPGFFRNP